MNWPKMLRGWADSHGPAAAVEAALSITIPRLWLMYDLSAGKKRTGLSALREVVNRKRIAAGKPPLAFPPPKPRGRPGRRPRPPRT